jgi:hypothetical protein
MPTIFEQASRIKLRFETSKGMLSAEDLWDLPLTSASKANLDDIARALFKNLQGTENVSFVNKEGKADAEVQLAFDVVKHIIDTRLVENAAAALAKENKEKKQRILAIIEGKEIEKLGAASIDELRAMAASL